MTPRILEFEDNRVKVTAEAYAIPEVKALLDKYDMQAEPYLTFVHAMSAIDSPYINIPDTDKVEAIVFDIQATLGDFDFEDPLLEIAIQKLKSLYMSPMVSLTLELAEEVNRIRIILRDTPIIMGEGGNFKDRKDLLKEIGKISTEFAKVKELADKELQVNTKGGHEVGGGYD